MGLMDFMNTTFGQTPMETEPSVLRLDEGEEVISAPAPVPEAGPSPYAAIEEYGVPEMIPRIPDSVANYDMNSVPGANLPVEPQPSFGDVLSGLGSLLVNPDRENYKREEVAPELYIPTQEEAIAGERTDEGVSVQLQDFHPDRVNRNPVPQLMENIGEALGAGGESQFGDMSSKDIMEGKEPEVVEPTPNPHARNIPTEDEMIVVKETADNVRNDPPPEAETGVNPAVVDQVAEEDPKGLSKAMTWMNDLFGITGKDLTRFAVLYAGSRVAGYGHGDSMGWAFGTAMKNVDTRAQYSQKLVEGGKYTPASIAEFKRTGDPSVLKASKGSTGPKSVDWTKPARTKDGKMVYPTTLKDGSKVYMTRTGEQYIGPTSDIADPETSRDLIDEYSPNAQSIIESVVEVEGGFKPDSKGRGGNPMWKVSAEGSGGRAMEIIVGKLDQLGLDIPPNSAYFTSIIEAATREAWNDAKFGTVVTDLQPYIESQFNYYASDKNWAKDLAVQGEKLDTKEWIDIKSRMMDTSDPRIQEAFKNHDTSAVIDAIMSVYHEEFMNLSDEEKAQYVKSDGKGSSGFHAFMKHKLY